MNPAPEVHRPRGSAWRPVVALLVVAALGLVVWGIVARRSTPGRTRREPIATRFPNARPGVRYVGDEACARCHSEIAASYKGHSMAQSLRPIGEAPASARGEPGTRDLFEAQGFHYSVEGRDGRTIHKETRRNAEGKTIGEVEGEVKYVLGSGTRGQAFLIRRGDYLFQSPITAYSQSGRWGLAPGFEGREARFERQIDPGCLVCHANGFDHVEGTEGRYREPIFRGHAIGCERCHGPGELHAKAPNGATSPGSPNIVNPGKLPTALREDVCQQCHLQGESTIARFGRDLRDFRPGLPLHKFETVFVRSGDDADGHPNAGHVEQMYRSKCFQASDRALGCISCHDPHELPTPEQKVAYYRERCLECHARKGCALPEPERRAKQKADSCVACHMPRAATSDIPHVSTTLHTIPRLGERALAQTAARSAAPGPPPDLVPFHADRMDEEDRREADRDLGVALRQRRDAGADEALKLLKGWLTGHPDDLLARESEAFALWANRRDEEAFKAFEAVLKVEPDRESSLEAAALIASRLRRYEESTALWRRAIAADPWRSSFGAELAFDLTRLRRWDEAAGAARAALKLNPASHTARQALVLSTLRLGSPEAAKAEFDTLLQFNPPDRDGLVRWFGSLR